MKNAREFNALILFLHLEQLQIDISIGSHNISKI